MKFLDALRKAPPKTEQRYSFSDWISDAFSFGGNQYPLGYMTTYGYEKAEPIDSHFPGYVAGALKSNGVVFAVEQVRVSAFSEARFMFQALRKGRPGELFSRPSLDILETPWVGGTTGDLLARMILDADIAGNFYGARVGDEIVRLRPDWVEIILEERRAPLGMDSEDVTVGLKRVGYFYYHGGKGLNSKPAVFLPEEICHFAPMPDPLATYRGMSWITPVVREIQADTQATKHKLKFFENAATPNLAVSLKDSLKDITPDQFRAFVEVMELQHRGAENAYKTLYTAGGADVTVIGASMQQLDFKVTQGAGETRIAAAGGVHPVIAGLSEGMQGSSLNAGNFGAARRRFADITMRPLWRNAAGSLSTLVPPPRGSRLWYDARDVGFLREDEKDAAQIQQMKAATIRQLIDGGYTPESIVAAVEGENYALLAHSGLYSVQLQPPGSSSPDASADEADTDDNEAAEE